MSKGEDRVFLERREAVTTFRFDNQVADVFDNMIRRSVPGYATLVEMLGVHARRHLTPGTNIYDLGCSLGTGLLAMRQAVGRSPVTLVGVDNSEAMVARCQAVVDRDPSPCRVELRCQDVREVELVNASLVVMNFTLQFVPTQDRLTLLSNIHSALCPGGALVLSEKLSFEEPECSALFEALHDEFRKQNGYSELEISQKRAALEKVLFPEPEHTHLQRLENAGFGETHTWFRCCNFASFLAVKSSERGV